MSQFIVSEKPKRIKFLLNQILEPINQIDRESRLERQQRDQTQMDIQAWGVIAVACVCLLMVHYLKYNSSFYEAIRLLGNVFNESGNLWVIQIKRHEFSDLFQYLWWGGWHLVAFILIPMLCIRFILKQRLAEFGWQWGEVNKHWLGYVLLCTPILFFAIIVSFRDDFANHYPFYDDAQRSWVDLISWEIIYFTQFIAVEFFFRGFLVNGLRVRLGSLSIAVMCLPYLMLHFPKLWLESTGAILFGFFLGILALRSKSIWGGVLVHISIALCMDMAALLQTKGLPTQWLP